MSDPAKDLALEDLRSLEEAAPPPKVPLSTLLAPLAVIGPRDVDWDDRRIREDILLALHFDVKAVLDMGVEV